MSDDAEVIWSKDILLRQREQAVQRPWGTMKADMFPGFIAYCSM